MNIECVRLSSDSSLYAAFEVAGKNPEGALAVVDADGLFIGSLNSQALVAELTKAGWHCGHASITDLFDGTAGVGIGSLIDTATPQVGPEVSAATVTRLLASLSSTGSSCGFVAVVDSNGVLLGTITHANLIAGLLAVTGVE